MTNTELGLTVFGFTLLILLVVAGGWITFIFWSRKDSGRRVDPEEAEDISRIVNGQPPL